MGTSALRYDRPLAFALAASLAIHLFFAYLLPAMTWLVSEGPAIETVSFTKVVRISVETPRPILHSAPPATAPHHAPVPHIARVKPRTASVHASRALPKPNSQRTEAPVVGVTTMSGASRGNGATATAPPQAPATAAAERVSSTTGKQSGGYLPLGAQQPDPVLDPATRTTLASLGVHVTLVVTVGDDGKTKKVQFEPPLDPQLETKIQNLLADASWDPAVCGGGIACEGQATIKL